MAMLVFNRVVIETSMPVFFQGQSGDAGFILAEHLQSNRFSRQYIIEISADPDNTSGLPVFAQQLMKRLEQLDDVVQVWPGVQPPVNFEQLLDVYSKYASLIYSLRPEQEAAQLFNPGDLGQRAVKLKQLLLGPQGYLVKSVAKHDPLLLTFHAFKDWKNKFQPRTEQSRHFTHLVLQSQPQAFDFDAHWQLQRSIHRVFTDLNQQSSHQFQYRITGVPVFAVTAEKEIKSDVRKVTVLSSLSVVVVFLILLRSLKAMHWTVLILASAMATGALMTTLVFGATHALTIALGATLIGVCIDYPIHTMVHTAISDGSDARVVVDRIWPSLLLGGLTTMIGYVALALTGYPGFQQIAVFALSGIASALLLTRAVLPALLATTALRYPNLSVIQYWLTFCTHYGPQLRGVIALLLVVTISLLPRLQWLDDLEKLSGASLQKQKQIDQSIRSKISTIEAGRVVLVERENFEQALRTTEQATLILQQLKRNRLVEDYYPVYPWLVSRQLQQRNLNVYQHQITQDYQKRWKQALKQSGLSVSKLGDLSVQVDLELDPQQIMKSQLAQFIAAQVMQHAEKSVIVIWLGQHDPAAVAKALRSVTGARYLSQRDTINRLAQGYRMTAIYALSAGLFIILLLLLLRYRQLKTALLILFPALCSTIFIFGCWCLLKQSISFLHLIGALLAIAICVDYGIFYSENRSGNRLHTYQAMAVSMFTTLAAFASLSISSNPLL